MPIVFECACGESLSFPQEHAGRRAKCPTCNAVCSVPSGQTARSEIDEDASDTPAARKKVVAESDDDDDDDDERGDHSREVTDRDEAERRRKKKKTRRQRRGTGTYNSPGPRPDRQGGGIWVVLLVGLIFLLVWGVMLYMVEIVFQPRFDVKSIRTIGAFCFGGIFFMLFMARWRSRLRRHGL